MSLQRLIKYYNQCYQADHRGLLVRNIFSSTIENRLFFENIDDELITGYLPYYPIDRKYGEETGKKISLAEKEKELIYCSTFIVGKDTANKYNNKICSPLFIIPAKIIETDNDYSVELSLNNIRVNFQIFNDINCITGNTSNFFEKIFDTVSNNKIDQETIHKTLHAINKETDIIDTSNMMIFPKLFDKKSINALYNTKKIKDDGMYYLVPGAGLAIVKKSINTRGIINELTDIGKNNTFSMPILSIFDNTKVSTKKIERKGYVPAILNNAQASIIDNSSKFPFTAIIGPPGTGKTYTISALTIEKMSIGKSILIVSKTDKAVDIIADKIENQLFLKNIIVRAGRSSYKKDLIKHLSNILINYKFSGSSISSKYWRKKIERLDKKIVKQKKIFDKRVKNEVSWGKIIARTKTTFFDKIKRNFINWRNSTLSNHFAIIKKIYQNLAIKNQLILELIRKKYDENVEFALKKERKELNKLLKALKSRRGTKQEELFEQINFAAVLKVFPIWLVKMSDIHKVLPLKKELFDYVIIDEATQCDIASTIPILQRGKNAIITGDPNQLRHLSFISSAQQDMFSSKLNISDKYESMLNYKNKSILDIVLENSTSNNQFVFLDEHYRSLPAIINFSNINFYEKALKIMTSRPLLKTTEGIELHQCKGCIREKAGYNKKEAQKTIDIVKKIINTEEYLKKNICSSIGILSPFRDQVEYISKEISKQLTLAEIKKHNIIINTAYGFQGDERDIMILSFALDNSSNSAAFRFLNKEDVFNVAITRARKIQHIVYSVDTKLLKNDYLIRQYIDSFENTTIKNTETQEIKNKFALDVKKELELLGFDIHIGFHVAGLDIDIVATKDGHNYGIDLIGYPGMFEEIILMERYIMLTRANLPTFPMAYTYWVADKNKTIQEFVNSTKEKL